MKQYDMTKLPKWAQEKISDLERRVEGLNHALKQQQQGTPSKIRWGRAWTKERASGYIPDDADVVFEIGEKPLGRIRVRLTEDGVYVNGDCSVQILCESSNCFTVQERPR